VRVKIESIAGNVVTFGSPETQDGIWRIQLKNALGTVSDAFVDMTLQQLQYAARLPGGGPSETAINAAIAMIAAAAPTNEIEAALATQMAVTHVVAMAVMSRIGGAHGGTNRLPGLASASAKLLRAYFGQVETFRRLRGGGEQNIRVEHVHVHQGGQAIVGGVVSKSKS
jgi:hypothetical protein